MSDLISRKVAIDAIAEKCTFKSGAEAFGFNNGLEEACKVIESLPAIQQERTAEKIEQEPIGVSKIKIAKCSACGAVVIIGAVYCWTCGARFKEDQDGR